MQRGARKILQPFIRHQLSSQKKVEAPLPTTEEVAASKIVVTIGGTWMSNSFHGLEATTRLNQSQRALSARFIF
jgi:hypothetical protein